MHSVHFLFGLKPTMPRTVAMDKVDSGAPTYRLVQQEIPDALREIAENRRPYVMQGSTGAGHNEG